MGFAIGVWNPFWPGSQLTSNLSIGLTEDWWTIQITYTLTKILSLYKT